MQVRKAVHILIPFLCLNSFVLILISNEESDENNLWFGCDIQTHVVFI